MKTSTDTIFIMAATVLLAVIFFAGIRERVVNMPRWFANPPASFEIIRQQAKGAQKFWIPLQILYTMLILAMLFVEVFRDSAYLLFENTITVR